MPDVRLAYRPFAEQVAFFQRKVNTPTSRWDDIQRGDHSHGFMVAGATRAALLDDVRGAVLNAIQGGRGFAAFQEEFESAVAKNDWHGWTGEGTAAGRAWRARTIYQTNIRQSYNAGRYAQLTHPDMVAVRPFWQYRHNDRGTSRVPRLTHVAWNGLILPWDDDWWKTHYPMNGWGCNCGVRALGQDDIDRMGLTVGTAPAGGNAGVDEGFDYNVGETARSLPSAAAFGQRVMGMPEAWRAIALDDAQLRPVQWGQEWSGVIDRAAREIAAGAARPRGYALPLGFLRPDVAAGLPLAPSTALLSGVDAQVYHLMRTTKGAIDPLLQEAVSQIPARLAAADTVVLFDRGVAGQRNATPALVYTWPVSAGRDGRWMRLVFHVDSTAGDRSMRQAGMAGNWLRTAGLVGRGNLTEPKYLLLRGKL